MSSISQASFIVKQNKKEARASLAQILRNSLFEKTTSIPCDTNVTAFRLLSLTTIAYAHDPLSLQKTTNLGLF